MKPLNVLVVDDEPMNLDLAGVILRREGHRVSTESNGASAVARCEAEAFDLVLMDINMPEMDGYEAMRALRACPATADLPILVVSGSNSGAEERSALEAGADLFMRKPYRRGELLAAIARVLSRHAS